MKNYYFIIFLLFSISSLYAQKISIEDILTTAKNDEKILKNQAAKDFTYGLNYKLPIFRRVDLRLGVNGNITTDSLDGNLRNEDYFAINFATNNLKEMRLQKALQPAQANIYTTESNLFLHQALAERYLTISNFYFEKKLMEERSQLLDFYNLKNQVICTKLNNGENVKVKDVLDTENDKNNLANSLIDYENNLTLQTHKIKQFLKSNNAQDIDFQNFITIDGLEKKLNQVIMDSVAKNHPSHLLRFTQMDYSKAELAYENARDRNIFSFFQAGYSNYAYDREALTKFKPSNNIVFRVGLTVPLPSNNNLKRSKAALQLKEDELGILLARSLQQKSVDYQVVKINNLLKTYRQNEKNIAESVIQKLLDNPKLMSQSDPSEILDLKIAMKKMKLRSLELHYEICTEYLRFLDMTGVYTLEKYGNFLEK